MLGVLYSWSGRWRRRDRRGGARRGETDPNSGQAYYNLDSCSPVGRKIEGEAITVIQKALRLEPIPPDNYVQQLALVYLQTGDCKEALAACEKGPQASTGPSDFPRHHGCCLRFLRQGKGGAERGNQVLRINPKFTVESFMRNIPYKNPSDKDRTVQGLRKAGLP